MKVFSLLKLAIPGIFKVVEPRQPEIIDTLTFEVHCKKEKESWRSFKECSIKCKIEKLGKEIIKDRQLVTPSHMRSTMGDILKYTHQLTLASYDRTWDEIGFHTELEDNYSVNLIKTKYELVKINLVFIKH